MRPLKLVTVVGARPQFIKAAVVCRAVAAHNAQVANGQITAPPIEEILLHTGQHYDTDMSQVFFDELQIPAPKYNLNVGSAPHGRQTADMLVGIERVLLDERPDVVLVYGDTNSTLAGAMAAAKLCITIAHVEAGLRSFNRRMPEEINRILTDAISDWLFCPTKTAVDNLASEGRAGPGQGVHQVGDVMYDSVLFHCAQAEASNDILNRLGQSSREYYLATVHRAENTDDHVRLSSIVESLSSLDRPVVWPMHPRTWQAFGALQQTTWRDSQLQIIEPLGYGEMLALQKHARAVLTDSGGMQKEAYFLGVPCITLRRETEWTELVTIGANRLAGHDPLKMLEAVNWANSWEPSSTQLDLYGDGRAGERIVKMLCGISM